MEVRAGGGVTMIALRYHRPATVREACALGRRLGAQGAFLAGGTELIPDYHRNRETAQELISLRDLSELRGISQEDGTLRIGSLTTVAELARSPEVAQRLAALTEAARSLGSPQIRSRATVGGNFCRAVSCADLPPAALVGDARLRVASPEGVREIAAADFFVGSRRTVLGPDELLVAILLPATSPGPRRGTSFARFGLRKGLALAVASVAARLDVDGDTIVGAAAALGAVSAAPMLARAVPAILVSRKPAATLFADAAAACAEAAQPISDVRGSAAFRRDIVAVLARRALEHAAERAATESAP